MHSNFVPKSKTARWTTAALLVAGSLTVAAAPALANGAVGEVAPGFQLKGIDGKTYSLADYKGKTVVLEWLNPNCPFSDRHAREKTMSTLAKQYGQVVWLGIDSSNLKGPDYMTAAAHQAWAQKNGINYAVLMDETGATGHAYQAKTTPHMFIIDAAGKIAYNGAIDDDPSGRKAKAERANYVGKGLTSEAAGKSPDPASTKPYGCSVKY